MTVRHYALNEHTTRLLVRAAHRLYDWQEPELPNDLFFALDGRPMMVTLASEEESYLILSDPQRDELVTVLPWLEIEPLESLSHTLNWNQRDDSSSAC